MVEMQDITSTGVANPTHAPSTAASSQPTDDHQLVMHIDDVHKIWADGKHAVKGISLKVRYGDTFALLGVNGAGKSSLLTMIAGSTSITKGNISVFGEKLPSLIHGDVPKRRRTFSRIGICPQHDALWGTLNPEVGTTCNTEETTIGFHGGVVCVGTSSSVRTVEASQVKERWSARKKTRNHFSSGTR